MADSRDSVRRPAGEGTSTAPGNERPGSPIIRVDRVFKEFIGSRGQIQRVLEDVTLEVHEGEFVCVLGPTGCGKSTLLNLIAGFDVPSAGEITVYGRRVVEPSRERVVVFQDAGAALFGWRTVLENIDYALRFRGIKPTAQRRRLAQDLLRLVHLDQDGDKYPHRLSGGGKQRAQIARALATNAGILLMDEPLAALDALTKLILEREIALLVKKTGKTVVYITHDILESALMSDRVVILSAGPGSGIRVDLRNDLPRPRSLGDEHLAKFVRQLESIVIDQPEG